MIVYKTTPQGILFQSRTEPDSYVLQTNEYSSSIWYQKPFFNGSYVVESITQAEIDERLENETEQIEINTLEKELQDGKEAFVKLKTYLKRNLSESQFKSTRIQVKPVFEALRAGDWDIALDEITIIDDANSTAVSRKIKTRIENYIN